MSAHVRRRQWSRRIAVSGALVAGGLAMATAPAGAHASAPSAPTFGGEPNPAGGTGVGTSTPPYAPGQFTTIYLRAAGEQSTDFNGSADTNVDVQAIVPAGWTNPQCGPAKLQVNNASTNNTNQPGADAPGWSCEVITGGPNAIVRWFGPQVVAPQTNADAPAFFVMSVVTPTPAVQTTYDGTNGTEGFIVDQKYASGAVSHWIPSAGFTGTAPVGTTRTDVASGLVRTVAGPGTKYTAITPNRLLDSRTTLGGWNGKLVAGTPRPLAVTGGSTGVPSDADAVVLNVVATGASAGTYVTVFPTGVSTPLASNLNLGADQNVANLVVVKVGTAGQVTFVNGVGSTDIVADVVGYFSATSTGRFTGVSPSRVLDSRTGTGFTGPLTSTTDQMVTVRGVAGVPSTADAVVVNLTVTAPSAGSFVTMYPSGESLPTSSTINFAAGQTVANLAIAKIGTDGKVALHVGTGTTQVIADVVGYFDANAGSLFHSVVPSRILDSRLLVGGFNQTPLVAGTDKALKVRGVGGVRTDATAVLGNATVTSTSDDSYLAVTPAGTTGVATSTLNYTAGSTVPNLVASKIGTNGGLSFGLGNGTAHVVFDVVGYFSAT
ncbi:MAG: hypothetical protein AB7L13_01545 [Acidimicrobiia bacterium]